MKKLSVLILSLIIIISFAACSKEIFEESTNAETQTTSGDTEGYMNSDDNKTLIIYFSRYGNTDFSNDADATSSASIVIYNDENTVQLNILQILLKKMSAEMFI